MYYIKFLPLFLVFVKRALKLYRQICKKHAEFSPNNFFLGSILHEILAGFNNSAKNSHLVGSFVQFFTIH